MYVINGWKQGISKISTTLATVFLTFFVYRESSVDKPTKESTQVSGLNGDDGVEDDDISVLELPVGVSSCSNNSSHGRNHSSKEPTVHSPALTAMEAAGDLSSSSTASSGPGSESRNSSQVSEGMPM